MQSLSIYSTVTGSFEPIKHVICMTCISECLLVNLHCGPLNPLCDSGSHLGRIEQSLRAFHAYVAVRIFWDFLTDCSQEQEDTMPHGW